MYSSPRFDISRSARSSVADERLRRAKLGSGVAREAREPGDRLADVGGGRVRVDVQALERGRGEAVLLLEQGEEKVRGSDLGVPRGTRDALRGGDRLLAWFVSRSGRMLADILARNLSVK